VAWEGRKGRRYLYRGARRGGRVVKEYLGRGLAAELADALMAAARRARAAEARTLRAERARFEPPDRLAGALDRECGRLAEAALLAAGFWRPNYTWRRRRGVRTANPETAAGR
jgi:hypothetical protein